MEVVDLLNDLYTMFDSILEDFDCYKVSSCWIERTIAMLLYLPGGNDRRCLHGRQWSSDREWNQPCG